MREVWKTGEEGDAVCAAVPLEMENFFNKSTLVFQSVKTKRKFETLENGEQNTKNQTTTIIAAAAAENQKLVHFRRRHRFHKFN